MSSPGSERSTGSNSARRRLSIIDSVKFDYFDVRWSARFETFMAYPIWSYDHAGIFILSVINRALTKQKVHSTVIEQRNKIVEHECKTIIVTWIKSRTFSQ